MFSKKEHIKNNYITIWVTVEKDHILSLEFQADQSLRGEISTFQAAGKY